MKPGIVNACEGRSTGWACGNGCGLRLGSPSARWCTPLPATEALPLATPGLAFVRASKGGLGFTMALGSGFVIRKLDQVWGKRARCANTERQQSATH